jgi:Family of unknown function (DUF5675)
VEILIKRQPSTAGCTTGELLIDGVFSCYTLEDVVREIAGQSVESWKVDGRTAIPRGRYEVIIDKSTRFQRDMPHILNVPGFTGVRIHSGNTAEQTEGCVLVGKIKQENLILKSRDAFNEFFPKLQAALQDGGKAWITIE